ncbi:RRXRR domain-containing protein [Parasutterella sp.]|uniref:RRXRR domain-containing protein n=1 Tax=Parasutterella sp. TaxID=2049037 RepID=UPI003AEF9FA4
MSDFPHQLKRLNFMHPKSNCGRTSPICSLLSARRALRQSRRNRKTRYRAPRFDNRIRTKRKGWLAPSVENRINAHLSRIEAVLRLLPITKITVETASFDMQRLKNPDISRANVHNF